MNRRARLRNTFLWAAGLMLLAGGALAYIPSAGWLLDKVAEKRGQTGLRRLKVQFKCADGEQTLYIKAGGRVRREFSDGAVELCLSGKCYRKEKGEEKYKLLPAWTYLRYYYFAEHAATGQRYLALMRGWGVDTKVDTLARLAARVAVVLGAKDWERDRPQFWLDKDLYLPLRFMVRDGEALMQIDYLDWGSQTSGDWFPGRLKVFRDGREIESCETTDVDVKQNLSDELFKK